MLFKADYKTEIIKEAEYPAVMASIEKTLAEYAVRGTFDSFDGCQIAYEYYLTENSRASVIIVHGFTEFSQKYHEMCWYFMRMGYSVFLYDQRGHGLSGRSVSDPHLAHIENFYDYVRDLEEYCDRIVIPNTDGTPIYLYSQSMGGAVSALYLAAHSEKIDRAVLSAPMICPETRGIPRKIVQNFVKKAAGKYGWENKFKYAGEFTSEVKFDQTSDLSRNRFEYYLNIRIGDIHYQNSSSTNRWIHEALSVQDILLNRRTAQKIKSRVLIISAENDTVVRNRPQQIFASLLPLGRFVQMAGAKHNLYNSAEPTLSEYVNLILNFFGEN